jgi:hypothetical protein
LLAGCDFSSSPSRRKPIVFATGSLDKGRVQLAGLQLAPTLEDYAHWLELDRLGSAVSIFLLACRAN